MSKLLMRFIFCVIPALTLGLLLSIINPWLGLIVGVGLFGLGFDVTRDHK